MKFKCAALVLLSAWSVGALADNYLSVVGLRTDYGQCSSGEDCRDKPLGYGVRFGADFPESWRVTYDDFSIDGLEFGYSKFGYVEGGFLNGKKEAVGRIFTNNNGQTQVSITQQNLYYTAKLSADAMHLAFRGRYAVDKDFSLRAALGVAYVSTTVSVTRAGISMGSMTENHFSPHISLGVSYVLFPGAQVVAGFEMTRQEIAGQSDRVKNIALGLAYSY